MANLLTGCWLDFVLNFRCTLISGQLSKRLGGWEMGNGLVVVWEMETETINIPFKLAMSP